VKGAKAGLVQLIKNKYTSGPIILGDNMENNKNFQEMNDLKTKNTRHNNEYVGRELAEIAGNDADLGLKAIKMIPEAIRFFDKPSEEMQINAVITKASVFEFIEHPCEKAIDISLERNPLAVAKSEHITSSTLKRAVDRNGFVISVIKQQTEEMCISAVSQSGAFIRFVHNASEYVQMLAVEDDESNVMLIPSPTRKVIEYVIEKDINLVKILSSKIDEALAFSITKKEPKALKYVQQYCFSERVVKAAVEQDGLMIGFVHNPSEILQEIAVRQNPQAIHEIMKPSDKLKFMTM